MGLTLRKKKRVPKSQNPPQRQLQLIPITIRLMAIWYFERRKVFCYGRRLITRTCSLMRPLEIVKSYRVCAPAPKAPAKILYACVFSTPHLSQKNANESHRKKKNIALPLHL